MLRFGFLFWLLLGVSTSISMAITQSITLNPGWNAVYLEVEPENAAIASVAAGVPVESVWGWTPPRESTVQYIQNPEELLADSPQWAPYFPESHPQHFLTELLNMHGGRAYLVKVIGEDSVVWNITGTPILPKINWQADSFFLTGFHVEPGAGPFFETFLNASSAHQASSVYLLNASTGAWEQILDLATTRIEAGRAYWVDSSEMSDYTGPLTLLLEQSAKIDFGNTRQEQSITISNTTPNEPVSVSSSGTVPLYYWKDATDATLGWNSLSSSLSIPTNQQSEYLLRLGVRRSEMTQESASSELIVNNGEGMRLVIPVHVTNTDYRGLWVGYVHINQVNHPTHETTPDTPLPTSNRFRFRVILHVDSNNDVRLLREVVQMWEEGTTVTDPETGVVTVGEPGKFVLVTDQTLLGQFTGASMRNGKPVGKRISAPNFSFTTPPISQGGFGEQVEYTLNILPEDTLNPFQHRYHPDHDNLNEHFDDTKVEAYAVTRHITFDFDDSVLSNSNLVVGLGDSQVVGIYKETLNGLHKNDLNVEGTFRLFRAAHTDQLNGN